MHRCFCVSDLKIMMEYIFYCLLVDCPIHHSLDRSADKTRGKGPTIHKKPTDFEEISGFLVRPEGFEPPAFWSVGCLKAKSESFRLRFVLFATVRSADIPLFPSGPARFFRILGQKWVRVCERSEAFSQDSLCGVEVIKAASQTPL